MENLAYFNLIKISTELLISVSEAQILTNTWNLQNSIRLFSKN